MFRTKDLCPTPGECPAVLMDDPMAGPDALPCDGCPAILLEQYLASPGGQLLSVVSDLDFALQAGVKIPLAEFSYPEFLLLRQLVEERERFQTELLRKKSPK